jgi:hypothetical protein
MPKKDRAKQPAPFLITAEASIETSVTIASEHMPPEDPDRLVISEFSAYTLVENDRASKILDSIRFCRVRNTYDKEIAIWEIGFAPLAPQIAKDWYTSFRRILIRHENAHEKTGVAPKSAIERRLEKCLKDLEIWK